MTRHRSVKRIFDFSSGMRHRAATGLAISADLLNGAPRGGDLVARRLAELVGADLHLAGDLARSQHLDRAPGVADQAQLLERGRVQRAVVLQLLELVQV